MSLCHGHLGRLLRGKARGFFVIPVPAKDRPALQDVESSCRKRAMTEFMANNEISHAMSSQGVYWFVHDVVAL